MKNASKNEGFALPSVLGTAGLVGVGLAVMLKSQTFQLSMNKKAFHDTRQIVLRKVLASSIDCARTYAKYQRECDADGSIGLVDRYDNEILGNSITSPNGAFHEAAAYGQEGFYVKARCLGHKLILRGVQTSQDARGNREFFKDPVKKQPLDFDHASASIFGATDQICEQEFSGGSGTPLPPTTSPTTSPTVGWKLWQWELGPEEVLSRADCDARNLFASEYVFAETPQFTATGQRVFIAFNTKMGFVHSNHLIGKSYLEIMENGFSIERVPILAENGRSPENLMAGINGITHSINLPVERFHKRHLTAGRQYSLRYVVRLESSHNEPRLDFYTGPYRFVVMNETPLP